MPTLSWIGKEKVVNHHQDVPYRILEHKYSFDNGKQNESESKSGNKIIHGDNLEALKALLPEYEGKIKCIYIDPPYNTGKESWMYNDNVNHPKIKKWLGEVVGKEGEDLSRHDKWLCMMYPRLKLLHKLLSENGVIFISINDIEQAYLKHICLEIFGQKNFLAQLIWNSEGNTDNQLEIKINHEYILLFTKNNNFKDQAISRVIDPNTRDDSNLWLNIADNNINKNNPANPPEIIELPIGFPCSEKELFYPRKEVDNLFFDITKNEKLISNDTKSKYNIESLSGLPIKLDDLIVKNNKLLKPCRIYGGLANRKKLEDFINNGCKEIDDDGTPLSFYINRNAGVRYRKENVIPRNILSVLKNFNTTEKTRTELKKMGINFNYPKPVELIQYLIKIGSNNTDNHIVLDSFAGSGTTAHSVLNLNKEDGGNRKFILIEMEDYAENISANRIKTVINGYSDVKGIGGTFDFYELGISLFIDGKNLNEDVPLEKIRQYIFYTETGEPLDEVKSKDNEYFLNIYQQTAYYFYYKKNEATTLDYNFLSTIKSKSEQYVIYADNCLLDTQFLLKKNIIFKKIPRDITKL